MCYFFLGENFKKRKERQLFSHFARWREKKTEKLNTKEKRPEAKKANVCSKAKKGNQKAQMPKRGSPTAAETLS